MTDSTTRSTSSAVENGRDAVADARANLADTVDAVRGKAGEVGDRLPEVVDRVRTGATESARTFQSWPESTQQLVAAFSLGLGVGLTLTGAPRLAVGITLVPAMLVAATILGNERPAGRPKLA
jgi:hypothetical protein